MTRETKVGLLVGMGVILLIGIIISDHLSVVQQQNPADLPGFAERAQQSINPLVRPEALAEPTPPPNRETVMQRMQPVPTPAELQSPAWRSTPAEAAAPSPEPLLQELPRAYALSPNGIGMPMYEESVPPTSYQPRRAPGRDAVPSLTLTHETPNEVFVPTPAAAAPATAAPVAHTLAMGNPVRPQNLFNRTPESAQPPTQTAPAPAASAASSNAGNTSEIIHYVAKGETLFAIAAKYYDNGDYWRIIAEHNPGRVGENGRIVEGARLVIPNRAGLAALGPDFIPVGREAPRRVDVPATRQTAGQTIEVQPGDTLSGLASRHLGSANRWNDLYEANRDQLSRPEALRAGMKLKLPGSSAGATVQPVTSQQSAAASQRPTPAPATAKTHTVRSGENLSLIAERHLGSRDKWREIFDANRDKLASPDALVVGQELKIP